MKDTGVEGPAPSGSLWELIIQLSGIFLFSPAGRRLRNR